MANTGNIDYGKLPETLEAIAKWFCRNTAASRGTIMPATCMDAATAIRVLIKQNTWLKSDPGHNADWEEMIRVLAEIEAGVFAAEKERREKEVTARKEAELRPQPKRITNALGEEYGSNPGQLNERYGHT